jgi:hypothetical protein
MSSLKSVLEYINVRKTEENYGEAKKTVKFNKDKVKVKVKVCVYL